MSLVATIFIIVSFALPLLNPTVGQKKASLDRPPAISIVPRPFEIATVKPAREDGRGMLGFLADPSGQILVGNATLKMLIAYAFKVQDFQILGGDEWVNKVRYNVMLLPPSDSKLRTAPPSTVNANPNEEQRGMLQTLLTERFGLAYHVETRHATVYLLSQSGKGLHMTPAKDESPDARGAVVIEGDGTVDGRAFGTSVSSEFLAAEFSRYLHIPITDATSLKGTYDYNLAADDSNNRDVAVAVLGVIRRLGLSLKKGRGEVITIVIDSVTRPSPN